MTDRPMLPLPGNCHHCGKPLYRDSAFVFVGRTLYCTPCYEALHQSKPDPSGGWAVPDDVADHIMRREGGLFVNAPLDHFQIEGP